MLDIVQRFAEYGYQIEPEALELIRAYPGQRDELIERVMNGLDSSVVVVSAEDLGLQLGGDLAGPRGGLDSFQQGGEVPFRRPSKSPPSGSHPSGSHPSGPYPSGLSPSGRPCSPLNGHDGSSDGLDGPLDNGTGTLRGNGLVAGAVSGRPTGPGPSEGVFPFPASEAASLDAGARVYCDHLPGLEVVSDITGRSTCVGNYSDFVRYFRDRYAKIRDLLSRRLNARPMESLGANTAGREVNLIGMVMNIRNTAKGHRVVELEDPTGMVTVIFQKDSPAHEQSLGLVTDEVVGVTGVSDGADRIFGRSLMWPDLQSQSMPLERGSGGALLLSDLHIGSKYFMEAAWERFIGWIRGEVDDPSGLSSKVKYIVIAGDLVDGIGVYPGQEPDLAITDIYEQYEAAAEYLSLIPKGIEMVISPGNHDMVRQAEPQPALPEDLQKSFSGSISFVGNPAWISLGGTSVLVYHGRSIDDLVLRIPGLSYKEPEKVMVEMLRRRHLCPIYGNRVSIAPEKEDHYVIERPPAILHCGHVHILGITRYKGVMAINSGTWQSQTDFQKKMNIQPTPGIVPHVDLETMKVRKLIFA